VSILLCIGCSPFRSRRFIPHLPPAARPWRAGRPRVLAVLAVATGRAFDFCASPRASGSECECMALMSLRGRAETRRRLGLSTPPRPNALGSKPIRLTGSEALRTLQTTALDASIGRRAPVAQTAGTRGIADVQGPPVKDDIQLQTCDFEQDGTPLTFHDLRRSADKEPEIHSPLEPKRGKRVALPC
jgi:hypothetical protein